MFNDPNDSNELNDTFDTLPDEAVLHIVGFFSDRTLLVAGSVNRRFRQLQKAVLEEKLGERLNNPKFSNFLTEFFAFDPITFIHEITSNLELKAACKEFGTCDPSDYRYIQPEDYARINASKKKVYDEAKKIVEDGKTPLLDKAAAYHLLYLREHYFGGSEVTSYGFWRDPSYKGDCQNKTVELYQQHLKENPSSVLAPFYYLNLAKLSSNKQDAISYFGKAFKEGKSDSFKEQVLTVWVRFLLNAHPFTGKAIFTVSRSSLWDELWGNKVKEEGHGTVFNRAKETAVDDICQELSPVLQHKTLFLKVLENLKADVLENPEGTGNREEILSSLIERCSVSEENKHLENQEGVSFQEGPVL